MRDQNVNTKEQLKLFERTAETQLRAWIGIETATIAWDEQSNVATLSLGMKNYGQTAAFTISSHVTFDAPASIKQLQPALLNNYSEIISGPGNIASHRFAIRITAEDKRRLDAGDLEMAMFGTVDYTDVFDKERSLIFLASWGGKTGTKNLTWHYQADESDPDFRDLEPATARIQANDRQNRLPNQPKREAN
jgi:hypothetical protein